MVHWRQPWPNGGNRPNRPLRPAAGRSGRRPPGRGPRVVHRPGGAQRPLARCQAWARPVQETRAREPRPARRPAARRRGRSRSGSGRQHRSTTSSHGRPGWGPVKVLDIMKFLMGTPERPIEGPYGASNRDEREGRTQSHRVSGAEGGGRSSTPPPTRRKSRETFSTSRPTTSAGRRAPVRDDPIGPLSDPGERPRLCSDAILNSAESSPPRCRAGQSRSAHRPPRVIRQVVDEVRRPHQISVFPSDNARATSVTEKETTRRNASPGPRKFHGPRPCPRSVSGRRRRHMGTHWPAYEESIAAASRCIRVNGPVPNLARAELVVAGQQDSTSAR